MSENKIGRPEKYSSNSEREKIQSEKNKEYQKEYLKVRRKRYEEDASYRESIILREREAYIKNNPNFKPKGFGLNAGKAGNFSSIRNIVSEDGNTSKVKSLGIGQMAQVLNIAPKVLSNWISTGKFPAPKNLTSKAKYRVYLVAEANNLAKIVKKYLCHRAYFRSTDTELIQELRKSIE